MRVSNRTASIIKFIIPTAIFIVLFYGMTIGHVRIHRIHHTTQAATSLNCDCKCK